MAQLQSDVPAMAGTPAILLEALRCRCRERFFSVVELVDHVHTRRPAAQVPIEPHHCAIHRNDIRLVQAHIPREACAYLEAVLAYSRMVFVQDAQELRLDHLAAAPAVVHQPAPAAHVVDIADDDDEDESFDSASVAGSVVPPEGSVVSRASSSSSGAGVPMVVLHVYYLLM